MNPGDTLDSDVNFVSREALNEGRGVNPGDTFAEWRMKGRTLARSTKAGA